MKTEILVIIAIIAISPSVMASIDSSLEFKGNGSLTSTTETLNDGSQLKATSSGPVDLIQSTLMKGTQRHSQMILNSRFGEACIRTPEYNLRMKGKNLEAFAVLDRTWEETAGSIIPESMGESVKPINLILNTKTDSVITTQLNANVFVRGVGDAGNLNRQIKLAYAGKRPKTIGDISFKGSFNFTDQLNLSGIIIQKRVWQTNVVAQLGDGDEL